MNVDSPRRAAGTFCILAVAVAALSLVAGEASGSLNRTVTGDLLLLVGVVGIYIFVGNSGVLSFGHVCFMSIGAYVASLSSLSSIVKQSELPSLPHFLVTLHCAPYVACLLGGGVAALIALVVSLPLVRMNGITAALTSFMVLQVVYVISANWNSVTGGEAGLSGIPITTSLGTAIGTAIGAILIALVFQRTRWGARLRASREEEVAARAIGVGVHSDRRIAFVLSAFVIGVAGGLYAQYLGSLTPETLYLTTTFLLLVMLITGGQRSVSGAVLGSLFVSVVSQVLLDVQSGSRVGPIYLKGPLGLEEVGLAFILLVTLVLRPAGLTGGREVTVPAPARVARAARAVRRRTLPNRTEEPSSEPKGT